MYCTAIECDPNRHYYISSPKGEIRVETVPYSPAVLVGQITFGLVQHCVN